MQCHRRLRRMRQTPTSAVSEENNTEGSSSRKKKHETVNNFSVSSLNDVRTAVDLSYCLLESRVAEDEKRIFISSEVSMQLLVRSGIIEREFSGQSFSTEGCK